LYGACNSIAYPLNFDCKGNVLSEYEKIKQSAKEALEEIKKLKYLENLK